MGSSHQVYTRVFTVLRQFHPTLHAKRLANWTWVIVGLLHARSVHLSVLALHLASDAEAAGRIARIRRWLSNPWIDSQCLYTPLIQQVLTAWRNREVTIMLDGCCVNHVSSNCSAWRSRTATALCRWPGRWLVIVDWSRWKHAAPCLNGCSTSCAVPAASPSSRIGVFEIGIGPPPARRWAGITSFESPIRPRCGGAMGHRLRWIRCVAHRESPAICTMCASRSGAIGAATLR